MRSAIYVGTLAHARTAPARHAFRYRACVFAIDLDEVAALDARLALFGHNRRRPVALFDRDHMGEVGRPIRHNVEELVRARGGAPTGGRILMLANLRVLGYVFNPITVFYCFDRDDRLDHVLAEVSNTFGERHAYLLNEPRPDGDTGVLHYSHDKRLHVSPFFGMRQGYEFAISLPTERVSVAIDVWEDGDRVLRATLLGSRRPLDDRNLARVLVAHPLMSHAVTARIHRQAVSLYRLDVPFHRKPPLEPGEGTRVQDDPGETVDRRSLRPTPPARRTPLTSVTRGAVLWALSNPPRGRISVHLPDGTVRRSGDPTSGPDVAVTIASRDLYRRLARRGRLGLGEAYVAGDWWADDLPALLGLLAERADDAVRRGPGAALAEALRRRPRLPNGYGLARARRDISYHYDLGNDFYELFLDETLSYSCAIWAEGDDLAGAQRRKIERILDRLAIREGDRVLEIGCGWGSLAIAAADRGAHVTGLTLSHEQASRARSRASEAGVGDRVEIALRDYRQMRGEFDAIASVEMLEAVPHAQIGTFLGACDRLLARGGRACIQSIAIPDQRYDRYRKGTDWIREYIFPGGNIPSLEAIVRAMSARTGLVVEEVENIGPHYADTLAEWRSRFLAERDAVRAMGYDEAFVRAWDYYLAFSEAGFRTGAILDYQILFGRPFAPRPVGAAERTHARTV